MTGWAARLLRRLWRAWLVRQSARIPFAARGANVQIVPRCRFENPERIAIGSDVYIGPGADFHAVGGLTIGDNISFSPGVVIHTSNHVYEGGEAIPYDWHTRLRPVRIASHVWIGAHALICPGVTIGEGAVVAMGAVVTRDVPPLTVVGGNPARPIRERDRAAFERLKAEGKFYLRMKRTGQAPPPIYLTPEEWDAEHARPADGQ